MDVETSQDSKGRRLDSWKEIAAYLGRDVRTVQRWERTDDLPVRRLQHSRLASVYAYAGELEAWRTAREPAVAGVQLFEPRANARRRRWLAAACLALVAVAVGVWAWPRSDPRAAAPVRSVAVLPMSNFSGDPQQEYFADGMTEALIARLSMVPGLDVTSRTSVMPFRNRTHRVPEIAKVLNVDAIVEASVVRSPGRVRITAKLIDARTDRAMWADVFDRETQDVLTIQSDIAQAIARAIEVSLSRDEMRRLTVAPPVSPAAFEAYLQGASMLNDEESRARSREAVRYFESAIVLDPTFAPAHLALARAYNSLGTYFLGGMSPTEARPKAAAAAREALRLDPNLSEAHSQLAYVDQREWRWSEAEAGFRRAIRLNPSDARAYDGLADLLSCLGRHDDAVAASRRARMLDPLSLGRGLNLGMVLYFSRRYEEAITELAALRVRHPDDGRVNWYLGNALMGAARLDEAIEALERSVAHERNPGPLGFLAIAYARAGRRGDAQQIITELESGSRTAYVPPAAFVTAYAGIGDVERAFGALERAYAEQSNLVRSLKVLPVLDPLRGDPRFGAMMRRVGLAQD